MLRAFCRVEVAACMDSMTKQTRKGEANSPARAKTGQRELRTTSWTEFVRLTHQAVVAFAGAHIAGGGGSVGRTPGLFATMLERADTKEAIGLIRSRLRSTRPV